MSPRRETRTRHGCGGRHVQREQMFFKSFYRGHEEPDCSKQLTGGRTLFSLIIYKQRGGDL